MKKGRVGTILGGTKEAEGSRNRKVMIEAKPKRKHKVNSSHILT